ncbi:hypothetical protein KD050_18950 [Psychrobacillus sp. INOP01]|uniref:hypothetical protein n=1 Tax=Psychrobacillus sp. INOP01 TaxID=2829187 RepID=UPI001BADB129|nr:hypothetical protein [Psychrobacillus sp. INOP01]QUG41329.1 hypothetical protein KD050_18950 [Psychrobacillus sp. INOP01]
MPTINTEDYSYFESGIYLPMLIKILERDIELINKLPFKLRRPYLAIIEKALSLIRMDLKQSEVYLLRHNMRIVIGKPDANKQAEYAFISAGYEERRNYSSEEMRSKSEELMSDYFSKY